MTRSRKCNGNAAVANDDEQNKEPPPTTPRPKLLAFRATLATTSFCRFRSQKNTKNKTIVRPRMVLLLLVRQCVVEQRKELHQNPEIL